MPRFISPDNEEEDLGEGIVACPSCNGKGSFFDDKDPEDHRFLEKTGRDRTCQTCKGSGYVQG